MLMGLFKSFDAEYRELYKHLTEDWCMKPDYAKPFLDAYKKSVGKMLSKGRKRMSQPMPQHTDFPHLQAALSGTTDFGQDYNFAIVGQAYQAYMRDLRRGKYVGTVVEKTIWAILSNRSDLVGLLDRPFEKYVDKKQEELFPNLLEDVFDY